jgi:IclR family transcriptional regulator, acetate operon repressor
MPRIKAPTTPLSGFAVEARQEGQASGMAIQVIERATRLLDALASQSDPVTLKSLANSTDLHPSTAHRILNDLVTARYVDRVDNGVYQLGNAFA